ncbi:hypothetical protein PAXINDRAFT_158850 [Paxillus involutus ATCC 200175]|uniref:Uncharacterized protein n=1 Tax=Paxillus involutus ATCC 200175 TaxID=664439 RepID=A0A0C9SUG1_PAXIN|nr:hypothetical protein PAXINDRAFT_158850 [Paxillus involutus ATCC 200175]
MHGHIAGFTGQLNPDCISDNSLFAESQPLEFHATAWGRPATDSITRQSDLERKMKMATEMIELHVTSPLSIFGHCSRTSSESLDELVDNLDFGHRSRPSSKPLDELVNIPGPSSGCCEGSEGYTTPSMVDHLYACQSTWGSYYIAAAVVDQEATLSMDLSTVPRGLYELLYYTHVRVSECLGKLLRSIIHDRKHGHALFTDPTGGSKWYDEFGLGLPGRLSTNPSEAIGHQSSLPARNVPPIFVEGSGQAGRYQQQHAIQTNTYVKTLLQREWWEGGQKSEPLRLYD